MWSWNPKPWHHIFDYAAMFGGILFVSKAPEYVRTDWTGLMFAGGVMLTGMVSYVVSETVMLLDKRVEDIKDARMFQQPTEEEKHYEENRIQRVAEKLVKTGGNTPTVIPMAEGWAEALAEVKREAPAAFKAYQNTAQVIGFAEVDNAIKKICRRTIVLVEHPDLGFPCGDFREVTWVDTKEMTRKTLTLAKAILERNGGVEKENANANARMIVKDLDVIKRGARTPLPHPVGCWCAGCAEK